MGIKYYRLFALLKEKGMKKTDLLEIMSSSTLTKLSKGDVIKTDTIFKLCQFLNCQPADIMEAYTEKAYIDPKTGRTHQTESLIGIEEMEAFQQELQNSDFMNIIMNALVQNTESGTMENIQEQLQQQQAEFDRIKKEHQKKD